MDTLLVAVALPSSSTIYYIQTKHVSGLSDKQTNWYLAMSYWPGVRCRRSAPVATQTPGSRPTSRYYVVALSATSVMPLLSDSDAVTAW